MDDVTWVVERDSINEVVQRLERCATASLESVERNAVRFGSKTEAMLSSRRRKHWQAKAEKAIQVGDQYVRFATRWLGM